MFKKIIAGVALGAALVMGGTGCLYKPSRGCGCICRRTNKI